MRITEISLRRPVTVLILTIALVAFGTYSYINMGVERMPNIEFPVVVVSTRMEGASPAIIDNDVTDVLEARINTIEGIKNISSSSYEGRSLIVVEFELDRNVDFAAADVRGKVSFAANALPDDCDAPQVDKYDPSSRPIMNIAVESDGRADMRAVSRYVDKIVTERLQTVKGVGSVQLAGFRDREIRVWVNTDSLEAYGLTTRDIKNAIYSRHVELPAGRVETGTREYGIRLEGEYRTVGELASVPIAYRGGAVIRLHDVARIEDDFEDRRSESLYDGKSTIMVQVRKQRGANEVALSRLVRERVEELNRTAPAGTRLVVAQDSSRFIIRSMNGVFWDIVLSICLTSVIMFIFLRTLRATMIAVITIPVCLLGSMSVMYWAGITINNMSMMGISLAVGMVVDATSVIMENISRHREGGKSAMRAAGDGASEVGFAVIAGAATTLAVFIPVAFMGGMMGRFFNAFGVTVAMTISISLLLSVTLTPFLCSRMLGRYKHGPLERALEAPFIALEAAYSAALRWAVRHRAIVIASAVCVFAAGAAIATTLGSEFFPNDDQGRLRVEAELAADTSLEVTERVAKEMIDVIQADPAVNYTFGVVGSGAGQEVYKASLNIELIERSRRPPANVVMARLRRELAAFRDVDIKMGRWGGSDITLVIQGPTSEALADIGEQIKRDLSENARGLVDITTDLQMNKPRINLSINRALADDLGVSVRDLSDELDAWFGGADSGSFSEGGYRYDIRIRAEREGRDDPGKVMNTLVRTEGGQVVRVEGIVESSIGRAPNVIKRYNRQRSIQIGANVDGISPGEGIAIMEEVFKKYAPRDGTFSITPAGDSENMRESFGYMTVALVFAVVLVYIVMAIQFESFLHPFTVMFSLPLMTAGSFGLLKLLGLRLSVMSFMGIILLVGVVVNNAILLVDFINQLRARGVPKAEAVSMSGPLRLRAILMTTFSTMIGNLPVALALSEGGEVRQPMSAAVIGGLFTSTLLTLFVIPVLYLIFDDVKDWAAALVRRARARVRLRRMAGAFLIAAALSLCCRVSEASPAVSGDMPINVREALELALRHNAELRILRVEAERAKAFKILADGAWMPSLKIDASAETGREPRTSDGTDRELGTSVSAALSQPLYTGGRVSALRRQSAQVIAIAGYALINGENAAAGELLARFYNVLLCERRIETEEAAVRTSEAHLREIGRMAELGMANRLEVIRAEQRLAANRAELASARGGHDRAAISLMNFMALPPEGRREVRGELEDMDISGSRDESILRAMASRADLRALKEQSAFQRNQIEIERSASRPTVSLGASAGYDDPYRGANRGSDTWRAELLISVPVLDRGLSRSAVADAAAELERREITREQKELDIKSEIENAWIDIDAMRDRLEAARQALGLAAESLRLAEVGFREGVTPQLDLLTAQESLTGARLSYLSALYDHIVAVIRLRTAEGRVIEWAEETLF